jgi:branched-chain amino acid transport system substrate-binding protein
MQDPDTPRPPAPRHGPGRPATAGPEPPAGRSGLWTPSGSGVGAVPAPGRRRFLRLAGLSGATAGLGAVLAGCGDGPAARPDRAIKLGYVSPQSGPIAAFGEADNYVLNDLRSVFDKGVNIGGSDWGVEIHVRDSQSNSTRAKTVAEDLINNVRVDMMLAASTPDTINPVADLCEEREVPCVSTVAPWQTYYLLRQKDPDKPPQPFHWTYHFYWGAEDVMGVFTRMWEQIPNNKTVGTVWSDDSDGKAWRNPKTGLPPILRNAGYRIEDPGLYRPENNDFSHEIDTFQAAEADILTGAPSPPDFATFWNQTNRRGYKPKIATMARALLFPAFVEAMGDDAEGLSMAAGWTPAYPYESSLTKASAGDLGNAYAAATGRQWIQLVGFVHALFEVAIDSFRRAGTVQNKEAVVAALRSTKLNTVVGPLDFAKGPVPNVAKTPVVGGQWRRSRDFPFELVVVSNEGHPEIPTAGDLEPMGPGA